VHGSAEDVARWRKQPFRVGNQTLPATLLKHAEDQTVLAVKAVFDVIDREGWHERTFADWGVLAAPTLFGRVTNAHTIERFRAEGPWGVSPHLIPHQSLHAVSGTISQALKIHGPNFGVGGDPHAGPDAFLLALAMLADGALPGVWAVFTGHEREWIPSPGEAVPPPVCHGLALALTPWLAGIGGAALSIHDAGTAGPTSAEHSEFDLASFMEALHTGAGTWRLGDSLWLDLDGESGT
jgi:hypothetical protein